MTRMAAGPVHNEHPEYAKYRAAPPGHWLRSGVTAALAELNRTELDQGTAHLLDLVLRDALALTAATGDTCRFQSAASAVRHARTALRSGEVPQARDALTAASAALG
jgi:hypothetical protein